MPGRGGADIGEPLKGVATEDGLWCRGVPTSAEECRVVPGRGGVFNIREKG